MYSTKVEPKYNLNPNPRIGLIALASDFMIEKDFIDAIKNPREIHLPLVEAYLARRALDYLVGFNISPNPTPKTSVPKTGGTTAPQTN